MNLLVCSAISFASLARDLTVSYTITNGAGGSANMVMITSATATTGVYSMTPVWYSVGDIASGDAKDFLMHYYVPSGVGSFTTTLTAKATGTDGLTYIYP